MRCSGSGDATEIGEARSRPANPENAHRRPGERTRSTRYDRASRGSLVRRRRYGRPRRSEPPINGWEVTVEVHDRPERSPEQLLLQDSYTPEELATLLEMDVNLIREAAFNGRLKAQIVDHEIVSISRADALRWLAERD